MGPSLTLLGSLFAWDASVGSISAAAEITPAFEGVVAATVGEEATGAPSALRFLESLEMGLMSCAESVSVVE